MKKILFIIPLFIFLHAEGYSQSILIKPKQVLDVRTGEIIIGAGILVEDGFITKVSKNIPALDGYEVISLPETTILPGLMDSHVHLTGNTDLKGYEGISESSYLAAIYGVKNAKQTLMAGFTTVRNVGAANYADVALRDAIDQKAIIGPTLLVSGPPPLESPVVIVTAIFSQRNTKTKHKAWLMDLGKFEKRLERIGSTVLT